MLVVRGRLRAYAWRVGGELDGGRASVPVRAMGRARLGPGAGGDQEKFLVAAVALRRLARTDFFPRKRGKWHSRSE
jgi:hypothetical protein